MTLRLRLPVLVGLGWLAELELVAGPVDQPQLRAALGLTLLILAPGWALRRALFLPAPAPGAEAVLLTLGLSIVSLILTGLALAVVRAGFGATEWMIGVGALTVGALVAAGRRRIESTPLRFKHRTLTFAVAPVLLVAVAVTASVRSAHDQEFPGFTQLWMTRQALPDHYAFGVTNREQRSRTYRLLVTDPNHELGRYAIALAPGETWRRDLDVGAARPVTASLLLPEEHFPYRQVRAVAPCPGPGLLGVCSQRDLVATGFCPKLRPGPVATPAGRSCAQASSRSGGRVFSPQSERATRWGTTAAAATAAP
jgi:hypothetical protein